LSSYFATILLPFSVPQILEDFHLHTSPKGTGQQLKIGKAAEAAGVSKQSLQYYLMVGLIEPSSRTAGGQQLFNEKTIERIRLIKQLNDSGYPLREIREIFLRREQQKG